MHAHPSPIAAWRYQAAQYYALTKPRVVMLAAFCALIGMLLASEGMVPWPILVFGTLGISLLAGAGFAFNCLIERNIDARMSRTRARPLARGEVGAAGTIVFAGVIGGLGAWMLYAFVNPLTMWLTLATFVGYAVIYTVILKPATPQNIVIGGASGAMPPVLGWAAVANDVTAQALVLFLIIFVWTPPHFWALALYRVEDYRKSGLPMLPVTHGSEFTRLNILLYTLLLVATTVLPYLIGMSGVFYLLAALVLGGLFLVYAWYLWRDYSDALARKTFGFSIFYLAALFGALLVDHYL
ncbi:MAG TPA: heme o synthase [Quisquiliibacterium sp.]|nr:heme o synthase [Quisquiliibacterium sp.]HQN14143.1 heme o synthase [Quisquiliibacterium sp.]